MRQIRSYADTQQLLLSRAIKLLKVGGTIVYSTCSISICENEDVVGRILNEFGDVIELAPQSPFLGRSGWRSQSHQLSDEQLSLVQRFVPIDNDLSVNSDTIGFFIAKFVKTRAVMDATTEAM